MPMKFMFVVQKPRSPELYPFPVHQVIPQVSGGKTEQWQLASSMEVNAHPSLISRLQILTFTNRLLFHISEISTLVIVKSLYSSDTLDRK